MSDQEGFQKSVKSAPPWGHFLKNMTVLHFGSKHLGRYGYGWTIMKKDGTEIVPNKERPTSLDIRKICAAYGCNKNCGHQGEF